MGTKDSSPLFYFSRGQITFEVLYLVLFNILYSKKYENSVQ